MSATAVLCRSCRFAVASKHHSGRLHVDAAVGVTLEPNGLHGPFLRLTCPCGTRRDYTIQGDIYAKGKTEAQAATA